MPEAAVFVSAESFATLTSLGKRTIQRLIAEGKLPSFRVGRRRLIARAKALDALQRLGNELQRGMGH